MPNEIRSFVWEAPEHRHIEKSTDWYWALGIVAIAASVASIIFGNVLFGVIILLAAATMILMGHRHPRVIQYEVSARGIRIHNDLHPFTSLEAYGIDGHEHGDPQLIVKSRHFFSQLLILPLHPDDVDDIDYFLSTRLVEEQLTEPFSHRLLEFFGF